ncbi:MAG: uroporphyrinogen-III synthase [Angustibacter sp.]
MTEMPVSATEVEPAMTTDDAPLGESSAQSTPAAPFIPESIPQILGQVTFVGTGPGDLGLLTQRAIECISSAEVIVLDRLLTAADLSQWTIPEVEFLQAVPEDAAALTPAACARLLTRAARRGQRVVRLIDGDPTMFTGFADEARACRKAELAIEVVPGVPAHTAVSAYAGIPLTVKTTRAVHIITPHDVKVDWAKSVAADVTVVVQGPVELAQRSLESLAAAGRKPTTAVAITVGGTTTEQHTRVTTLEDAGTVLIELSTRLVTALPLLVVVGEPVNHRDQLSWFETKPLFGWRVLVPRTKDQAAAVTDRLAQYGAVGSVVPTISVEPPRTPQQMERAIKGLVTGRYEWVGFTSVNAVRAVRERFEELGLDARAFSGLKVAAVGGVTAASLREWGIVPDLVPPEDHSAQGLLEVWPPFDDVLDPINRVVLPRADIATENLVAGLQEMGWEVDDITAYRTVRAAPPAAEVRDAIKSGKFDAVVFTSSSTVRNLVGIAGKPHPTTVVACIGPATRAAALEHGLRVDVLSAEANVLALVDALAQFGAQQREQAVAAGEQVIRPSQRRAPSRRKSR